MYYSTILPGWEADCLPHPCCIDGTKALVSIQYKENRICFLWPDRYLIELA